VQADPATNSLIITAPEPQYRQLRAVIDQLDGRRAQVLVESLIVEVNADKAAEFGIQWQNVLGTQNSSLIGVLGSNFTIGGTNIIDLATKAASGGAVPAPGFNLGTVRNVNGTFVLNFLARFFQSSGDGNVLSTPTLLTLDNEEAKIVIGQNVPFVTGQFTNTGTSNSSVNPFQTIERKDVGLTLRVKPQINDNGTVRLTIYQEASSVKAGTEKDLNGPTTNKRQIESNVLVDDGGVIVLGGLLQDQYSGNEQKVPGLGDVPVIGNLFRTETRSRSKTNLMVFLRPVIMRDSHGDRRHFHGQVQPHAGEAADRPAGAQHPAARRPERAAVARVHLAQCHHARRTDPLQGVSPVRPRPGPGPVQAPRRSRASHALPPALRLRAQPAAAAGRRRRAARPLACRQAGARLERGDAQVPVRNLQQLEPSALAQRISAAYAQGESSAATVVSEVQNDATSPA
jgi:type II secretory pathway component GspD/PulD (secretin)